VYIVQKKHEARGGFALRIHDDIMGFTMFIKINAIKCCRYVFEVHIVVFFSVSFEITAVINFNKHKEESLGLRLLGSELVCTYRHMTIALSYLIITLTIFIDNTAETYNLLECVF
jgi:hypothetical protein